MDSRNIQRSWHYCRDSWFYHPTNLVYKGILYWCHLQSIRWNVRSHSRESACRKWALPGYCFNVGIWGLDCSRCGLKIVVNWLFTNKMLTTNVHKISTSVGVYTECVRMCSKWQPPKPVENDQLVSCRALALILLSRTLWLVFSYILRIVWLCFWCENTRECDVNWGTSWLVSLLWLTGHEDLCLFSYCVRTSKVSFKDFD